MSDAEKVKEATDVTVPPLPVLEPPAPRSVFVVILPAVMLAGTVGFLVIGGGGTTSLLMGGLMVVSLVGMMIAGGGRQTQPAATVAAERDRFLRRLERSRAAVDAAEAEHRATDRRRHPHADALVVAGGGAGAPRSAVRVGTGAVPAVVSCVRPADDPDTEPEPFAVLARRWFLEARAETPDMPLTVDLRPGVVVSVSGSRAADLVRGMVLRCARAAGPTDCRIAVFVADDVTGWDWLKWLPHHRGGVDHDQPLRTADVGRLLRWIDRPGRAARTVVVLVSPPAGIVEMLAVADRLPVVAVVVDGLGTSTVPGAVALHATATALYRQRSGGLVRWGTPDLVGAAMADVAARALAGPPHAAPPGGMSGGGHPVPDLVALLGLRAAADHRPETHQTAAGRDLLRIPIGTDDAGTPVHLDLKEAALGGMGPHGLVIGATGSGKSELLRTIVLALVVTHGPATLNVVLIDFKGGAAFLGLEGLPHVAAVITNLADEAVLVERMRDALNGELRRRQQLLRTAGASSTVEYQRIRTYTPALPALPTLVVVCDEFTELLVQQPDLAETFVALGRLGRSLGVHLILASQRLEEGRMRGLDAHLSFRIALKTFSAADSRAVLGDDAAYRLPTTPGVGYLKDGAETAYRFTAAFVSGAVAAPEPARVRSVAAAVRLFGAVPRAGRPADDAPPAPPTAADPGTPSLLQFWVSRLLAHGPRATAIWLPPLDKAPPIDDLAVGTDPLDLRVPVGLIDRPFDQRRDLLWADFTGSTGHALVVGGARSGKTTLLTSMLLALSRGHGPDRIHCHVLDLGGGGLTPLAGLPQVGSVGRRGDPRLVHRMLAQLAAELGDREASGTGESGGHDRPDVFLVIDGWATFRAAFEELEPTVTALVQRGLAHGIHVILATARWADVRPAMRDLMTLRFELRLGDPAESEIDRRRAAGVPARTPGRGLTADGLHFLVAPPGPLGAREAVEELISQRRTRWPGAGVPPIRLLPATVAVRDLPRPRAEAVAGVPIGVAESDLRTVGVDVAAEPFLLVWGDGGSGRTSFLRTFATTVAARWSPTQARFLIVDHRRTLLGRLPEPWLAGHSTAPRATAGLIADAVELLTGRLPSGDVRAEQLRDRGWWTGADLFVLVDDYDLVAAGANPLLPLLDLLPHARDIGLHIVVCRRAAGGGRALYDPLLQQMRELGASGLVLSGPPDEGPLHGDRRAAPQPPGRGFFVTRTSSELIQLALADD
ncbi:type VII secretion protein EccCb [Nakamurella deserti]|uniref:type VII secretion protein EccCb n=1 Tax=Nakamurella deserti TaxID=2164074 RepID=UPI0014780C79|nr:type VII secretion protein EccCb [Nakamurella deserti]